jgi:phosphatidylinositol kinase/protein kinase (PI-3  family)
MSANQDQTPTKKIIKNVVLILPGKDDLRQDAVMQQVFGLMNTLLRNDPNTRKRRLQIRQYKVVIKNV